MGSGIYRGSAAIQHGGGGKAALVRADVNPDADPEGYLYGRVVVFTGGLATMTRQVAWDECSKVGAFPEKSTTKRTNVLVVGDINAAVLRPGATLTKKAEAAFALQDKGQDIEVMTEDDFLRCLDGRSLDAEELLNTDRDAPLEPLPNSVRATPLAERDQPRPLEPLPPLPPPKPLRRERVSTSQVCCIEGCSNTAAFPTRTKPTWCDWHIADIQRHGGIRPLEPFSRADDWQLTECLTCRVQAHYRFVYTLDKNRIGEATCRACHWRDWAAEQRSHLVGYADLSPIPYDEAKAHAEEHGYDYLGPLAAPSLPDDPHHVKCRRCGRISAQRLGDIGFGCECIPRR